MFAEDISLEDPWKGTLPTPYPVLGLPSSDTLLPPIPGSPDSPTGLGPRGGPCFRPSVCPQAALRGLRSLPKMDLIRKVQYTSVQARPRGDDGSSWADPAGFRVGGAPERGSRPLGV